MASQQPDPPSGTANNSTVEMTNLAAADGQAPTLDTTEDARAGAEAPDTAAAADSSTPSVAAAEASEPPSTDTTIHPPITRTQTEALGPATDSPVVLPTAAAAGPVLTITLMLTTGARHPYKIDEKYLRNRKVDAVTAEGGFDPRELSGYQLKELIWTDWRTEWEPRPASPSAIRLILLGRLLDDKAPLKDFPFKLDDTNVVHMTVKPADFLDDEETAGKSGGKGHSIRGRDGEDRGAGCRCVIL